MTALTPVRNWLFESGLFESGSLESLTEHFSSRRGKWLWLSFVQATHKKAAGVSGGFLEKR